jgi:hypothetical protein
LPVIRNLFRIGAGILTIILIIQLGANTSSEPPLVITGLEWNIKSGDSLVYEINVTATRDDFNELASPLWAHLNNTRIVVRVTQLPLILPFYSSTNYIKSIVMTSKVSCRFENGTLLYEPDLFIESLVSKALLPVGSWEYLDSMFPDEWSGEFEMYEPDYTWIARFDEEQFFFGYLGVSWHYTKGWSARMNVTSGIPMFIETHDNYHDCGFTIDILELTLVDYVSS